MATQRSGHVVNITTSIVDRPSSKRPSALPRGVFGDELADAIHLVGRKVDLGRIEVLLKMGKARGKGNRKHQRRAVQQPGERYLRHGGVVFLADGVQNIAKVAG